MKSTKSDAPPLRLRVPIIATLLVGVLIGVRGAMERKQLNHAPNAEPSYGRSLLPFSASDVANYFSSVLEKQPTRAQGNAVLFEDSNAVQPAHRYRVVIIREHNDLVITFSMGSHAGMNLAREFFQAAFFKPDETERLLAMIDHAQGGPNERFRRFTISMRMLAYSKDARLTVRLSP
jgi:hypothetical protein